MDRPTTSDPYLFRMSLYCRAPGFIPSTVSCLDLKTSSIVRTLPPCPPRRTLNDMFAASKAAPQVNAHFRSACLTRCTRPRAPLQFLTVGQGHLRARKPEQSAKHANDAAEDQVRHLRQLVCTGLDYGTAPAHPSLDDLVRAIRGPVPQTVHHADPLTW